MTLSLKKNSKINTYATLRIFIKNRNVFSRIFFFFIDSSLISLLAQNNVHASNSNWIHSFLILSRNRFLKCTFKTHRLLNSILNWILDQTHLIATAETGNLTILSSLASLQKLSEQTTTLYYIKKTVVTLTALSCLDFNDKKFLLKKKA